MQTRMRGRGAGVGWRGDMCGGLGCDHRVRRWRMLSLGVLNLRARLEMRRRAMGADGDPGLARMMRRCSGELARGGAPVLRAARDSFVRAQLHALDMQG